MLPLFLCVMLCLSKRYIDNPHHSPQELRWANRKFRELGWSQIASIPRSLKVPCGDCVLCRMRATAEVIGRLIAESYSHNWTAYFVTLTLEGDRQFDVNRDHVKPLCDAIRKSNRENGTDYKFYITSEYGGKTSRPHYHGMFYGFNGQFDCKEFILKYYKLGNITCEPCSLARFRYTANAHVNKCSHVPYKPVVEDDELFMLRCEKPFVTCSNGLGKDYFMLHADDIIKNGYVQIDGIAYPVPRTMMDKIYESRHLSPTLVRLRKYASPDYFDSLSPYIKLAKKYNYDYGAANIGPWLNEFCHYLKLAEQIQSREYLSRFILKDNKNSL